MTSERTASSATNAVTATKLSVIPGEALAKECNVTGLLLYVVSGALIAETEQGRWILPSQRALWVPPRLRPTCASRHETHLQMVYISAALDPLQATRCCLLEPSRLLRELIARLADLPRNRVDGEAESGFRSALLDELANLPTTGIDLPLPTDPRARKLAERLKRAPNDATPLGAWAATVGASERTLARLFRSETSMTFSEWRARLRMQTAVEELSKGRGVAEVAQELGYETASGFIDAFRRIFGTTPGRYFAPQSE